MATGRLGVADLTAATDTTVYTVPASTFSVVTISVCNRSTADRTIRLAIADDDAPTNAEYIEYDVNLIAHGVLERTGVVIDAGKKVVARSNIQDVSVVVYGIETDLT